MESLKGGTERRSLELKECCSRGEWKPQGGSLVRRKGNRKLRKDAEGRPDSEVERRRRAAGQDKKGTDAKAEGNGRLEHNDTKVSGVRRSKAYGRGWEAAKRNIRRGKGARANGPKVKKAERQKRPEEEQSSGCHGRDEKGRGVSLGKKSRFCNQVVESQKEFSWKSPQA